MFIIRNAVRNIRRSKGRSILIGILITIIAFSISIGLYIRQASSDSRDAALSKLNITAQITQNRSRAMKQASGRGIQPVRDEESDGSGSDPDSAEEICEGECRLFVLLHADGIRGRCRGSGGLFFLLVLSIIFFRQRAGGGKCLP